MHPALQREDNASLWLAHSQLLNRERYWEGDMTTRELRNVMSALLPQESERRLQAACESITTLSERQPGQVSYLILHVPAGSADSP